MKRAKYKQLLIKKEHNRLSLTQRNHDILINFDAGGQEDRLKTTQISKFCS
jgi:hypothetical protein